MLGVRDHSNLAHLWLNAAPNTQEKNHLFRKTKSAINEIKFGDPLKALKLSNELAATFLNFKQDQCQSICNLVAKLGERGARKLNKLFEAVLFSQRNQETPNKQIIAFIPEPPPTSIDFFSSWMAKLQIDIEDQLKSNREKNNPDALFIPLTNDVIDYLKSNFLDANAIYQLNNTIKVPISSTQWPAEIRKEEMNKENSNEEETHRQKIDKERIIRKDLIMLINRGKISLKSIGIVTLQELINYLGEDVKLVTRLTLCSNEGLVENHSKSPPDIEFTQLQNHVTRELFNKVLDNFPNLNELIIVDPLSEDLAELLSLDAFANQLEKVPIEKLCLNCCLLTNIDFLNHFPKLTQIELHECKSLGSIDTSKYFSKIKHLEIRECTDVTSLETLSQLETLSLREIEKVKSLDLSELKNLINLELYNCPFLYKIAGIDALINLRELRIHSKITNLDNIHLNFASLTNLEILELYNYSARLTGLDKLKHLKRLFLTFCIQLSDYNFLKELTKLRMFQADNIKDEHTDHIASLKNLLFLDLKESNITNLNFLKDLKKLKYINFSRCKKIRDLSPLQHHPSLKFLNLSHCNGIYDITPLSGLPLKELILMGISLITITMENKKVFKTIPTLTLLDLSNQSRVDVEYLASHPALREVYLRKNAIDNEKALLEIPSLDSITIDSKTKCSEKIIKELTKKGVTVNRL